MKVLLVSSRPAIPQMDEMEPIGICYLSAALKAKGHSCRVIHQTWFHPVPDDAIVDLVKKEKIDLVGFATYYTNVLTALDLCRRIKKTSPAFTLLGGPMATAMPELLDREGVDFIIQGEAEEAIAALAQALQEGGSNLDRAPGLCFSRGGERVINPPATRIRDLDSLPFPDRGDLPYDRYFCSGYGYFIKKKRVYSVITSRGCPFNCEYCATKKIWQNRWYARSVENVMAEIEPLVNDRGDVIVSFMDQDISINKKRAMALFEAVAAFPRPFEYGIMTSLLALDEELIEVLDRTGCLGVFLGIESGSKEVLDDIGRSFDLERTVSILKALNRTRLFSVCAYMIGFPNESREDVRLTRKVIRTLPADFSFASLVNPFPGTDLYQTAVKEGWIEPDVFLKKPEKLLRAHMPTYHMTRKEVRREFLLTTLTCFLWPGYLWHVIKTAFTRPRRTKMMVLAMLGQARLAFRVMLYNLKSHSV